MSTRRCERLRCRCHRRASRRGQGGLEAKGPEAGLAAPAQIVRERSAGARPRRLRVDGDRELAQVGRPLVLLQQREVRWAGGLRWVIAI